MTMEIKNAAVIGAGVMGSAIAAQFANAGIPVLLLDTAPPGATQRSMVAENAIKKLLSSEPQALMLQKFARAITAANIDDDLDRLRQADWIVEAVSEDLATKQGVYRKIAQAITPNTIISSNTSTLPLTKLTEGLPDSFVAQFLIAHFFNPPRYVPLLEIVAGAKTRSDVVTVIAAFADERLGKSVLRCRDTPGFIANRIGAYWLMTAMAEALAHKLTIEEADAVMSAALGLGKTGVFGLLDLVGLDVLLQVDRALDQYLPADDGYKKTRRDLALVHALVERGYTGRKGAGGFYRLKPGERTREAVDLATGHYRPLVTPALDSLEHRATANPRALIQHADKGGRYAWAVLSQLAAYAAAILPQIADDVHSIDRALKLGYNWKQGLFEIVDRLGAPYFAKRFEEEGREVPALLDRAAQAGGFYCVEDQRRQSLTVSGRYAKIARDDHHLALADFKLTRSAVLANASSSLWDIDDGVAAFEIHTKMNAIDAEVLSMLRQTVETVGRDFTALVIYNDGPNFSAGANLGLLLLLSNLAASAKIDEVMRLGQETFSALKYAPFAVVGAVSGFALGGGCELMLHCNAVQAHVESYIGLVEAAVGLVPGWGGTKELLARLAADPKRPRGPMPAVTAAFETIGMAKVSKSAFEARELGYLCATDGITFNRERLLADAKSKALELAADYRPLEPLSLELPGASGKAALAWAVNDLAAKSHLSAHDRLIADSLGEVLTGGADADPTAPVGEVTVLALERAVNLRLTKTAATLARMEHMLETGKPLRN